jgi:hypothetical protein
VNIQQEKVAIDIHDIGDSKTGAKLVNALIANGATVYLTKRGRKALLISAKNFDNLKKRMQFAVEESYDGTVTVTPAAEPQKVA